jgi:hypothetical protein
MLAVVYRTEFQRMLDRRTKFGEAFPARPCIGEAHGGCLVFRIDGGSGPRPAGFLL